jgi:hypothetical protein
MYMHHLFITLFAGGTRSLLKISCCLLHTASKTMRSVTHLALSPCTSAVWPTSQPKPPLLRMLFVRFTPHLPQPSSSSQAGKRSSVAHAAVAEKMSGSAFSQFAQPAGKGMGFYTGEDGYMYCDNLRVDDIRHQVRSSCAAQVYSGSCVNWVLVTCPQQL